jgi:hypothetical protein
MAEIIASTTPDLATSPTTITLPTATATPLPAQFSFGKSTRGADLVAYRLGTGRHILLLVGGIHAGFEANTVKLMQELVTHFSASPQDILPDITLLMIPILNPDGLSAGRVLQGRFNGNGVDLNRNWGCGWSADAVYSNGAVNAGSQPFSEAETQALGALVELTRPESALFYHSAARGVFAGNCERNISGAMAQVYGQAVGYPSGQAFSAYRVTGTAPAWLDSIGIPAADVELSDTTHTEFTRHLGGILALQAWLVSR